MYFGLHVEIRRGAVKKHKKKQGAWALPEAARAQRRYSSRGRLMSPRRAACFATLSRGLVYEYKIVYQ